MKAKRGSFVSFVLVFLVLAITVPLPAQQTRPPGGQRVSSPSSAPKQAAASPAQKLARQCREFLAPMKSKGAETLTDRIVRAEKELTPRFAALDAAGLDATEMQLRECATDLPSSRLRRDALHVLMMARDEMEYRSAMQNEADHEDDLEKQQKENDAELQKQQDAFREVAHFALAIYKENEERKQVGLNCVAAFQEELQYNRKLYGLLQEGANLMGQMLHAPASPLPVFVNIPAPQVIRVETPTVPRTLNCSASATPNLSRLPEFSTSTTWINCW